ncbi:pseudouridine synthase [Deminuibacter soli]|uniref:Pseudouridine synthase n=1 Tax=Deminuibacter soli TaxID=2291815 RepID=A0A3E1NHW6_9BACT|nr:pseudouridine synthase [Deminuibacter soli]RFM27451.1 rRNA pseudouridine synthase [Deminuibacter soli]
MILSHRYFVLNKPYNMLSQFVGIHETAPMLGSLDFDFPEGIHAVGRLDRQSEGLLLLTTNKKVTRLLFLGEQPHNRTYLVRVKNVVTPETLERLRTGVPIIIQGGETYISTPCDVQLEPEPVDLFPPAVPQNVHYPHSWLRITLTEGRFHQIRKMVVSAGHRCQRLIRTSIEDITLGDLQPGCIRELDEQTFFGLLHIRNWE